MRNLDPQAGQATTPESSIVLATYNRKETTLRCLANLHEDKVFTWAEIILVDDGSTDSTAAAVRETWPQVKILSGDGNLWWGGAMRLGMAHAIPSTRSIIWLNNDCRPRPGVLRALHDFSVENRCAASAISVTPNGFIYGGWIKSVWGLRPADAATTSPQKIDSFGGNCVAFAREVVAAVGEIDPRLFHNWADADYALRVRAAGYPGFILNAMVCDNDQNDNRSLGSWTESSLPFSALRAGMQSPRSLLYWPSRKYFFRKHWGPWGWFLALVPYCRFFAMWGITAIFGRKVLKPLRKAFRRGPSAT